MGYSMKLKAIAFIGTAMCSVSMLQSVYAGDMSVTLFYGVNPMANAEVLVDGVSVGTTNQVGALTHTLDAGYYDISIVADDSEITNFNVSFDDDQNVAVVVDASVEPAASVDIETYVDGDTAAYGVVTGIVLDETSQPVEDAVVAVLGTDFEAYTDVNGRFELKAPAGELGVRARHSELGRSTIADIQLAANGGVDLELALRPQSEISKSIANSIAPSIEETVVLGTAYNPSAVDAVEMEREAMTVVDALDFGQIERFGDSNVAAAVKRVVGVTIRDGKYAIIRGLEGRYIGTTLNGVQLQATDPLRRDVELDMFPSNILESIEVQKGFTADQLAESTAGALKIETRGVPDDRVLKFSLSGSYRDGVTGEGIPTYEGGRDDDFGADNGFRELPSSVRTAILNELSNNSAQNDNVDRVALAQSLTNVYNVREEDAAPGFSVSAAYGDRFDLDNGSELGFYATASWDYDNAARIDYAYSDGIGSRARTRTQIRADQQYDLNGYMVVGLEAESLNLMSKSLYIRRTEDKASFTTLIDADEDNRQFDDTLFQWSEREYISQLISGEHFFGATHSIDWNLAFIKSSRYQPDRRSYTIDNGLLTVGTLNRVFSDLNDDTVGFNLAYEGGLSLSDNIFTEVKVGVDYNKTDRDSEVLRVGFDIVNESALEAQWQLDELRALDLETIFIGDNLSFRDENGQLAIDIKLDKTEDTANYEAESELSAFYISTSTELGQSWTLVAGVRQENYQQKVNYPFSNLAVDDLDSDEWLTSLGLNFSPNDNWQFRASYANTISYPGLAERPEGLFFDPETDAPVFGNAELVASTIDNWDLRGEYYFHEGASSISAGIFFKDITNPIERAIAEGSGSARGALTYRNNKSAELMGIEIDANVELFNGDNWEGFIAGNLSYTDDKLERDSKSLQLEPDFERSLQGLSKYIANLQFGIDHISTGQSFTLVANYFDDRIDRLSAQSIINKAIVEVGRVDLGLNYEVEFINGTELSFKVSNLLDAKTRFERESILGQVNFVEEYKRGRVYQLGLSHSF